MTKDAYCVVGTDMMAGQTEHKSLRSACDAARRRINATIYRGCANNGGVAIARVVKTRGYTALADTRTGGLTSGGYIEIFAVRVLASARCSLTDAEERYFWQRV